MSWDQHGSLLEGNQIINTNEENLEETCDSNITPDLSIDTSTDALANYGIREIDNILADHNNNVVVPE